MKTEYLLEAPQIIKEFMGYIETIKGKSTLTVEEYYLDLRTFFRFLKKLKGLVDLSVDFDKISINDIDIKFIETISLTDVFEFMNYTKNVRHNGPAARARKTTSIRVFFKYLTNKSEKLEKNPVAELETPKLKKSLPKYLTLEQSIDLLSNIEGDYAERDYCMLVLCLNCGLRVSELISLNLHDIRSDNTIKITGKGNKERILYLNDSCIEAINTYLKVRPVENKEKNALFISRHNNRISRKTVYAIVKKYTDKIGLEGQGYSVHKLRHTAATLMYQHGNVDVRVLKDILGHENLGTTQIYTHVSDQQLQDASNSNPLSSVKIKPKNKI